MSRSVRFWISTAFGVGIAALAVFGAYLLFSSQAGESHDPKVRIDILRSALTVGAGMGGMFALVLAFRRQWHTEHETKQRQILEQHSQAMEQLGSDKAPVRIGALYSLERLANEHPELRPVVVNEICGYLRMPSPSEEVYEVESKKEVEEELNVRKTALRLLEQHLHHEAEHYWQHDQLDLFGAYFDLGVDFSGCILNNVNFESTESFLNGKFKWTIFVGKRAAFFDADFQKLADFEGARFDTNVDFRNTRAETWNFEDAKVGRNWVFPGCVPTGWDVEPDDESGFGLFVRSSSTTVDLGPTDWAKLRRQPDH